MPNELRSYAVYARQYDSEPWSLALVVFDELSARREGRAMRAKGYATSYPPPRSDGSSFPVRITQEARLG